MMILEKGQNSMIKILFLVEDFNNIILNRPQKSL